MCVVVKNVLFDRNKNICCTDLPAEDQSVVDINSITGCHFSVGNNIMMHALVRGLNTVGIKFSGARVLAKWEGENYCAGNILSRLSENRYSRPIVIVT